MTSGQETEQVYSYNPGARTGHLIRGVKDVRFGRCCHKAVLNLQIIDTCNTHNYLRPYLLQLSNWLLGLWTRFSLTPQLFIQFSHLRTYANIHACIKYNNELLTNHYDNEISRNNFRPKCRHDMPPPLYSSRGHQSALLGRADGNIPAVSHGQHDPVSISAAAWCANTAVSKAAWWPQPLTFWPWNWCPSHVWRGLPLCQYWSP